MSDEVQWWRAVVSSTSDGMGGQPFEAEIAVRPMVRDGWWMAEMEHDVASAESPRAAASSVVAAATGYQWEEAYEILAPGDLTRAEMAAALAAAQAQVAALRGMLASARRDLDQVRDSEYSSGAPGPESEYIAEIDDELAALTKGGGA